MEQMKLFPGFDYTENFEQISIAAKKTLKDYYKMPYLHYRGGPVEPMDTADLIQETALCIMRYRVDPHTITIAEIRYYMEKLWQVDITTMPGYGLWVEQETKRAQEKR